LDAATIRGDLEKRGKKVPSEKEKREGGEERRGTPTP